MYVIHNCHAIFVLNNDTTPVLRDVYINDELAIELPYDKTSDGVLYDMYREAYAKVFSSQHGGPMWVPRVLLTEVKL